MNALDDCTEEPDEIPIGSCEDCAGDVVAEADAILTEDGRWLCLDCEFWRRAARRVSIREGAA